MKPADQEPDAVAQRYARRVDRGLYSPVRPEVLHTMQERQRAMLRVLANQGWTDFSSRRLLEVGCGGGGNLLEALRLGFAPPGLTGLELLPERCAQARGVLPAAVTLIEGDALLAALPPDSFDIVQAYTVFSSLLDDDFSRRLAAQMWRWVKPGGGVLWYDFTVDNPRNPDVRGVPLRRVRALFPHGVLQCSQRVTLAPPLARALARVHPALLPVFNSLPWLRTHVLVWIHKPQ
jgi:SAM-dependent methyltransferase